MAIGARALMLGLPKESELLGHGVSDLRYLRRLLLPWPGHRRMIGSGDSALEEAMFLTVRQLRHPGARRGELRASKIMQERALREP